MIEAFTGLTGAFNALAAIFLALMIGALGIDVYRAWRDRKEDGDE